jgi:DNA-binding CsgD family transcriptional regulator
MAVREVQDRRGRAVRGKTGLLDRESSLDAINELLDSVGSDTGQALLIVGHPGMGKTRLYESAIDEARLRGFSVLHAAGSELEQNLAYGVASQLLRALLSEASAARRAALLAGAPRQLRLEGAGEEPAAPAARDELAVAHGLFTLLATVTEKKPALICVDDLHWSDHASLNVILYLLNRLDELPVAALITRRPAAQDELSGALDQISAHARVQNQRLAPLSPESVRELVSRMRGHSADHALAEVCRDATAGNPFYLHELLLALKDEPSLTARQLEERIRSLAPDAVTRSLRVRVGRLGPHAAALARAVAILGDDVPVRHAAALSGLTIGQASAAADALASVEVLLAREPLRFVHPIVRHVIEQDIPASERASRHLEAARLLHDERAGAELAAAHLLRSRPQHDPWTVARLREAAREALSGGAPQSAARYLERALDEPPAPEHRAELLAELGHVQAVLGLPEAITHLSAAADLEQAPELRARLALLRGRALHGQGRHDEAAAAFDAGLRELDAGEAAPDQELHDELESGFLATGWLVPWLQSESIERSLEQRKRALDHPQTHGQRLLLAQAAVHAAFDGEPSETVTALAEQGWQNGLLLKAETSEGVGWNLVSVAMCLAGELERAIVVADAALKDARRRGSPMAFATGSFVRGLPQLWRGQVTDALADLELARDARRFGWRQFTRSAAAHYCMCLIETGDLERAEVVLEEDAPLTAPYDFEDAVRLYALAELRLAQGRAAEALEVAVRAGDTAEHTVRFLGFAPWRTCAARAALALDDRERATAFAVEAFERAQRTRVPHQQIRTGYVLGICEGGARGLERIREAAALGDRSAPRLETVRALIELGAALRRANERSAARQPLLQAAELARSAGALALYDRARLELAATGARPRREARSGPESLTPSERRIADLAAAGRSNREIASALFVTPKTVEYHLRNAYRKLEIRGRGDLARVLGS